MDASEVALKRQVFISHSGTDTWVAKQIARQVRSCGARTFLDEEQIEAGADFEDEVLSSLDKSHELLVLMTPWSRERPYVWLELGAAMGKGLYIVAVLHGLTPAEIQADEKMVVFLKKKKLIDINEIQTYFRQLRRRARATDGRQPKR